MSGIIKKLSRAKEAYRDASSKARKEYQEFKDARMKEQETRRQKEMYDLKREAAVLKEKAKIQKLKNKINEERRKQGGYAEMGDIFFGPPSKRNKRRDDDWDIGFGGGMI